MNCNGFRFSGAQTVGTADATRLKNGRSADSVPAIRGLGQRHNKRKGIAINLAKVYHIGWCSVPSVLIAYIV